MLALRAGSHTRAGVSPLHIAMYERIKSIHWTLPGPHFYYVCAGRCGVGSQGKQQKSGMHPVLDGRCAMPCMYSVPAPTSILKLDMDVLWFNVSCSHRAHDSAKQLRQLLVDWWRIRGAAVQRLHPHAWTFQYVMDCRGMLYSAWCGTTCSGDVAKA